MSEPLQISTDVLVIGGGPAACWAAIHAREAGAEVTLVDKGYCGTSGATAPSGTGVWYVAPEATARANAKASREALGGHLADHYWMDRVLDHTYANMNRLAVEGRYPFPVDPATGEQIRTGVQGPEYMRRMRAWVKRAGVRILDHSPALELLVDDDGVVRGAAGYQRQADRDYRIVAGAVVLATGGCAFLSRALGTNVDTGDGALMAAEVGARFSGMEFSNAYAIVPKGSTITKTAYYGYATFFHEDGRVIEGAGSTKGRSVIARTLLREKVFAQLDRADAAVQAQMRLGQPNFFLQLEHPFAAKSPQKWVHSALPYRVGLTGLAPSVGRQWMSRADGKQWVGFAGQGDERLDHVEQAGLGIDEGRRARPRPVLVAGVGAGHRHSELSFDESQRRMADPMRGNSNRRCPRKEFPDALEKVVDAGYSDRSSVPVSEDMSRRFRATTGFDVLEDPFHQGWRDGLPSDGSALLSKADKAVVGVEVIDGQAEQSATATSRFDQDAHDQRIQWTIIASRCGNTADVADMVERERVSRASGLARSSDFRGRVVEWVNQPVEFGVAVKLANC